MHRDRDHLDGSPDDGRRAARSGSAHDARAAGAQDGRAKRARRLVMGAALVAAACLASVGTLRADGEGKAGVEDARALLEKWVEVRRILSQESRDWALGRETLADRTELVQREIGSLRGKIADAQASIGEADRKLAGLAEENERLKASSASLKATVAGLETRTLHLLVRLPDPIRDRVKPLSQRFPEDPETTGMSLSERFQNVVGVLNEVNKFQREITATSEVRTLGGGGNAEVTAIYLGIGAGYFATDSGTSAGLGAGTEQGWAWIPADEAGPAIATAISILKNEHVAEFVQLPVAVDGKDAP